MSLFQQLSTIKNNINYFKKVIDKLIKIRYNISTKGERHKGQAK